MVAFPEYRRIAEEVMDGVVLAYEERPSLTQVSALLVPVGALCEGPGEEGLAHLLEHMVFRGTKDFPTARDIMMAAEGSGGRINAYTTYDYIVFLVQMPTTVWKLSLNLLFQLAFFPLLREDDLMVEREVVLREMAMLDDDPSEKAAMQLQKAMWGTHRLGQDVIGSKEVIKNVTRKQLIDFWKEKFFRYPIYIVSIGSVPFSEIRSFIKNMEYPDGFFRSREEPWNNVDIASFTGDHIVIKEKTNQTYYRIAINLYPYRTDAWSKKKYHISLISALLGGATFSKIVQDIRDKNGWAYSVGATISGSVAGTSLIWYMDVLPGVLDQVKNVWKREITRLEKGMISEEEFEKVKTYVIGSTMMSSDSMHSTALAHLMNVAFNGHLWDPVKDVGILEKLTLTDVSEEFHNLMSSQIFAEVIYGAEFS